MSKSPGGRRPFKGRKPTPATGPSSTSKRIKKNVEEYFGEIVPTSNAGRLLQTQKKKNIEDYFGSEVDIKLRNLDDDSAAPDDDGLALPPKQVDLAELANKPSKDATDSSSILELTSKLQEVASQDDLVKPVTPPSESSEKNSDKEDGIGKRMSAMLMANAAAKGFEEKQRSATNSAENSENKENKEVSNRLTLYPKNPLLFTLPCEVCRRFKR